MSEVQELIVDDVDDVIADVDEEETEVVPSSDEEDLSEDNSDDSDESDPDTVDDIPQDDVEEEEKPTLYSVDEIPKILANVESDDQDVWSPALDSLSGIPVHQPDLISENISAFDIPRLLKVVQTSEDERRARIIDFFTCFPSLPNEPRDVILAHLPALIALLAKVDVGERQNILYIVDDAAENLPDTHETIIASTKALFEPWCRGEPVDEEAKFIAVLEAFENTIVYSRETTRPLFIRGHAFSAARAAIRTEKFPLVRLAGQSVLNQMFDYASEVDELSPVETERGKTLEIIITSLVNLIADPDPRVAEAGAQFLMTDREEPVLTIIGDLLKSNLDIGVALVGQLANKLPGTVGATCEYALIKLVESDEWKPVAVESFKTLWTSPDISNTIKLAIVSGLIDSFTVLREISVETGICECMMRMSLDEKDGVESMRTFDRLLENEQIVGFVLIQTDGAIDHYLRLIETSPSTETRRLAASTLARTLDSTKDGELQRPAVAELLTVPAVYDRIIALLRSSDLDTVNAVAKLVAEILWGEDGTQAWSYDEDSGRPPPPCPMKERTVTDELVSYTISLLNHPEAAVGAMALLCQFCWGYPRGVDVVQKAFEPVIPEASVFFLAALDGDFVSRHTSRQRRIVADAAAKAGGLERAVALLEGTHESPEVRRTAVEAFRVMLTAESVDEEIARKNVKLPGVLAATIADKARASLDITTWMIRCIQNETFATEHPAWSEFATPESVDALIYWMKHTPEEIDALAEEAFSEAYILKRRAHDDKVSKIQEDHQSILTKTGDIIDALASVLAPYSAQLIGPLLHSTNSDNQNATLLGALKKLVAQGSNSNSNDILVSSVRDLLNQPEPPSFSNCQTWITTGPQVASAFYLGGILDRIFNVYDPEKEEYSSDDHEPLRVLLSLVEALEDEEHILGVKKAFFANSNTLNRELEYVRNHEGDGFYSAWQSCEELGALSAGYPEGTTALEEIYPHVLKVFDNEELGSPKEVAPLIAALCHVDVDQLATLVRSFVSGLKPASTAPAPPATGKKKGKKNKKFVPRLSIGQVLERFKALTGTNPAVKKVTFDAGVPEVVSQALSEGDEEVRGLAFDILQALVDSEDEAYLPAVDDMLPQCLDLFLKEAEPKDPNLKLLCSCVSNRLPRLIEIGAIPTLYKGLSDNLGDHLMLFDALHAIGLKEPAVLTDVVTNALVAEDALVQESFWGNSYAIRRLIAEGESSAAIIVNAGAAKYALRLLQSEDLQLVAKGGALSSTLARIQFLQTRPTLVDLGIPQALEEGYTKCVAASKTLDPATEDPENEEEVERREKLRYIDNWIRILENARKNVAGEDVEGYEEDYFL